MSVTGGRVERRLAAVLAADIAGYSRLMGEDELGTLETLKAHRRELVDPAIASHRGRIVKTTGDGMLVEFASAVDAVTCAVAVQEKMAERNGSFIPKINFRIGINIGDIIIDGDDIFGDGVNVAARVETECEPGSVCLSGSAYEQVRGKTSLVFDDLGERNLKNIDRPVRLYAVRTGAARAATVRAQAETTKSLALPDKPSIAVLPFQNMSGDPEQEYFADGMVEEITTALSRFHWLFVIARTSTLAYKGRAVDVKQVSRELGVRYLLEGSVRKAASRVRITGQLIDAVTGGHIWADRFDGSLEDVFELQDQVAGAVVGAIDPKLLEAEMARVKRKPVASLDAYDLFLRASDCAYQWTNEGIETALLLLHKVIELDPDYAPAYAFTAWCYVWRMNQGVLTTDEKADAIRFARKAAILGKDDAFSLSWAGMSLAVFAGELDEAAALLDRALVLNPNLARSWNLSAWIRIWLGQPEKGIDHITRAMRLSPLDLAFHAFEATAAFAYLRLDRYDEASLWAERSLHRQPDNPDAWRVLAMSCALSGDLEKARRAMQRLLELTPHARIATGTPIYLTPERRALFADALRRAGMPE